MGFERKYQRILRIKNALFLYLKICAGQPFSVEQAAAQAFVFLIAGFETSAATIQFALYELALQPDLQKKLTEEIDRVIAKHNGQITYDGLQEMTLLDRVVSGK